MSIDVLSKSVLWLKTKGQKDRQTNRVTEGRKEGRKSSSSCFSCVLVGMLVGGWVFSFVCGVFYLTCAASVVATTVPAARVACCTLCLLDACALTALFLLQLVTEVEAFATLTVLLTQVALEVLSVNMVDG